MRSHKISLLDCTLRDGGYVNDWIFGNLTIRSIVSRLDNAGIDIIECGFLDSRVTYNNERSLFPDMNSVSVTLGKAIPKSALLVAMIDFGTFDENLLIQKTDTVLDGIRLIFKKEDCEVALNYAKRIKELGYKLFINPVALPSYSDKELLCLIDSVNELEPYAMSIVDTYGLMFNNDVHKYVLMIDSNLNKEIALGYHTHNNLQMANSHCITFVNQSLKRETIVDSTLLGMGKNAGNACTELLVSYCNKKELTDYHIEQILDCAYTDISKFNVKSNWGYSLDTLLSAVYECSPNWLRFLTKKKTLSIKDICEILSSLPNEKREVSFFNEKLAEQVYLDHISNAIDDSLECQLLSKAFRNAPVLLLCPGKTIKTCSAEISDYISKHKPIVISVNFVSTAFETDYTFISNANRYSQLFGFVFEAKRQFPTIILTSNIVESPTLPSDYVVNYRNLFEKYKSDNSTILLMALLKRVGVTNISIAGMDGFDAENENYFNNADMRFFVSVEQNSEITSILKKIQADGLDVVFITPSKYEVYR